MSDWLNDGGITAYPFNSPQEPVTTYVTDAMISVSGQYQGQEIRLTRLISTTTDPRQFEIRVGSTILISLTDPVSATFFGDYEVWHAASASGATEAQLVVRREFDDVIFNDSLGPRFVPNAIAYGASPSVDAILADFVEVAGTGENALFAAGSNIEYEISDGPDGSTNITVHARYNADGPCIPRELGRRSGIKRINGVLPDSKGDIKLHGDGIWVVDGIDNGLKLNNIGVPCCDCDDYIEMFERIRQTHDRLLELRRWLLDAQGRYLPILRHTKYLLTLPAVGAEDPITGEGPEEADCP